MSMSTAFLALAHATVARSNHHRIALDALTLLRAPEATAWRDLFLHHHAAYLAGAKAPDESFKDFKNHVLHVKDGYWGGAPDAALEWYRRTVRALQAKDWKLAAYNAGVMSHYVIDPVQPFHTGQTETETVIHHAVEWSFSKSYATLRAILLADLGGYPEPPAAEGPDWLRDMVRAGAEKSNPYYEAVIDHYDFKVGAKNPQAGLDQELKDIVAGLIGYATALLARVLDRAIADAGAAPAKVDLTLDTLFAAMAAPVRVALAGVENLQERALIAAQYAEFEKTGKVRKTLSEDDATVRRLHAEEVLKVPLSSLDCQWPREIGLAAGRGATARPKSAPARAPAPSQPEPAPIPVAGLALATAKPRLAPESDVVDAPSIGPKTAERFYALGVRTVGDFLALVPEDAAKRLDTRHINANVVRDWQAQAQLACSVANLSGAGAQILVACGVRDRATLASADPTELAAQVTAFAATPDGQSLLRSGRAPSSDQVRVWIESAREPATSSRAA